MSHINTIEIKNFKSIRHQKIEDCRRVNVFIGYPNVGKSNILEALGLFGVMNLKLQQFSFNEICRVRRFSELYFNQDTKETNSVMINDQLLVELIINEAKHLDLQIYNILDGGKVNRSGNLFSSSIDGSFNINSIDLRLSQVKEAVSLIKKYEFQKDGIINRQRPRALAMPYGNNLLDVLLGNSELRKEIVDIFKDYNLKLNLDTLDETIKFLKELDDGSTVTIPYHQVADTLRRLIFYKAAIQTNSNSVLLFEEPEAHMFPPYISKFTTDVIFDEEDNQFFIATHSPFVINDFMEELKDDELSIYVVGYKKEAGETFIRRLTEKELHEIYQYGIDIYYNLENYLMHEQQ